VLRLPGAARVKLTDRLRAPHGLSAALPVLRHAVRLYGGERFSIDQVLRAGLQHHGAGIRTLTCMLAVETLGAYPPMDAKFAAGLLVKGKVTASERDVLIGNDEAKFAEVYVKRVFPVWREMRRQMSAEDADNYLGLAGKRA
jgi:hypothetical protein